mmetsp:Transcript_16586/g.50931  ORF Transcript_16586/g.50931 Transcript_16586/m.50931 type:complete len:221 (+) Transcript_16586:4124-4786(+)
MKPWTAWMRTDLTLIFWSISCTGRMAMGLALPPRSSSSSSLSSISWFSGIQSCQATLNVSSTFSASLAARSSSNRMLASRLSRGLPKPPADERRLPFDGLFLIFACRESSSRELDRGVISLSLSSPATLLAPRSIGIFPRARRAGPRDPPFQIGLQRGRARALRGRPGLGAVQAPVKRHGLTVRHLLYCLPLARGAPRNAAASGVAGACVLVSDSSRQTG